MVIFFMTVFLKKKTKKITPSCVVLLRNGVKFEKNTYFSWIFNTKKKSVSPYFEAISSI